MVSSGLSEQYLVRLSCKVDQRFWKPKVWLCDATIIWRICRPTEKLQKNVCAALQKSDSDVKAMKKQAENLTAEYDRLLEEHGRLQVRAHACVTSFPF